MPVPLPASFDAAATREEPTNEYQENRGYRGGCRCAWRSRVGTGRRIGPGGRRLGPLGSVGSGTLGSAMDTRRSAGTNQERLVPVEPARALEGRPARATLLLIQRIS